MILRPSFSSIRNGWKSSCFCSVNGLTLITSETWQSSCDGSSGVVGTVLSSREVKMT